MKTLKLGKLLRILGIFTILCGAIGGALLPGVAYAQGTWSTMTRNYEYDLNDIWGSSPSNVFAVGLYMEAGVLGLGGAILRYDGNA